MSEPRRVFRSVRFLRLAVGELAGLLAGSEIDLSKEERARHLARKYS
jgi:hypothetical protein